MKKTNFKRILSFFLAAVMLFGMLPAVFAQDADTKDVDYAITNPYATVDWKNYDASFMMCQSMPVPW